MSVLCEYAIVACFGYFSKVWISHIAILKLFVFLLPISIMFRYLNHLVANKMAPSMCPVEQDGVVGFKQFCTIFPPQIWHLCGLHIFLKCHIKLTRLINRTVRTGSEDDYCRDLVERRCHLHWLILGTSNVSRRRRHRRRHFRRRRGRSTHELCGSDQGRPRDLRPSDLWPGRGSDGVRELRAGARWEFGFQLVNAASQLLDSLWHHTQWLK